MRGKSEFEKKKNNNHSNLQYMSQFITQFYAGCLYESNVLNKGIFDSTEYKENTAAW